MKIGIINTYDARDVKKWSGIPYHVILMIEEIYGKHSIEVVSIPLKRNFNSYLKGFYFNRIKKKNYLFFADKSLIKNNQKQYDEIIIKKYDLIITFQFFVALLCCGKGEKLVFWNDATFANLTDFYPYTSNLSNFTIANGNELQKNALNICDQVIFSSTWAKESAINDYNIDAQKVEVIAFGSNLTIELSQLQVIEIISNKNLRVINFLFLAVDWDRKGGDDALKVVEILRSLNHDAKLHVVGVNVPEKHKDNKAIISYGFINKTTYDGEIRISNLLRDSHFLILPSRADCTPVAFSEANSHGLPVITTDVGGISSIVKENENGICVPVNHFVDRAITFSLANLPGTRSYDNLCLNSYNYYQSNLSWKHVRTQFLNVLTKLGY